MKKFLSTLTSFSFIGFNSSNFFACINQEDYSEKNSSFQAIKSDLQVAKQFLLTNQLTIDTIFANENTEKYIDYLKNKHQNQIKNEINFLFDDNEFEGLAEGEQQVLAILNHHEENETVNVKFTILPDLQVANNILNKVKAKLSNNINAAGLLATSSLDQATIDKIINLVENQISNNNVQVTWISDSSLKVLESNKENKFQVELSIKQENETLLASKIVDITLENVSDSLEIVNQNLLNTAEQKLVSLDAQGLSENDDLSSSNLRQEIINLLQTVLNDPQINISLLSENETLKENNNEVKVKLTVQLEETKSVERDITVTFSNIISSQKHDNIIYLKDRLPEVLKSVDGSTLPSDFSINNTEVWKLINETINDPNVKVSVPPVLKSNIISIQQQVNIISNDLRWLGRLFGKTAKSTRKTVSKPKITKPKIPTKRTIKTQTKVKNPKSVKSKNESYSNSQAKKDSPEQGEKTDHIERFQEKMEQAEELSQSFINQLVDTNISAKLNDYNIFALATVGFGENAVTDIVPIKFINVVSNN